jgi:hypothetical protein
VYERYRDVEVIKNKSKNRRRQQDRQYISVTLHAVTFQKTTGFVATAVTTSTSNVKLVLPAVAKSCVIVLLLGNEAGFEVRTVSCSSRFYLTGCCGL